MALSATIETGASDSEPESPMPTAVPPPAVEMTRAPRAPSGRKPPGRLDASLARAEVPRPTGPAAPVLPEASTAPEAKLSAEGPVPVTLQVEPLAPRASHGIVITSPPDGHTLTPAAPPIIVVEGRSEDPGASAIWLVANGRRIAVRSHGGRFRQVVQAFEPVLRLWAETSSNGAPAHRSETVTVHASPASPAAGLLVVDAPQRAEGLYLEVNASWRASPERLDAPVQTVALKVLDVAPGAFAGAFSLPPLKPGVYTFELRYRAPVAVSDVRPSLYLPGNSHPGPLNLKPVSLMGMGKLVLAKVLFPHGILWEQDEWFSGHSETVDRVTKFRFPEGISWAEWKADLLSGQR